MFSSQKIPNTLNTLSNKWWEHKMKMAWKGNVRNNNSLKLQNYIS
jgi:hypothetical protein